MSKKVFASIWLHGVIGIILATIIYYIVIGSLIGCIVTPLMLLANAVLVFGGYLACYMTFKIFPEKYAKR